VQYQIFSVPASGGLAAMEDVNGFLRSHRVLTVERRLIEDAGCSFWSFCIEYLDGSGPTAMPKPLGKVDYREVLPPEQFQRFARMRELRKSLAEQEGVPPYAVFTNEQLAQMARLETPTAAALQAIPGVGEARMKKYGGRFLGVLRGTTSEAKHETIESPDAANPVPR